MPSHDLWNPTDYAHNSSAQFTWAQELIGKLALKGNEYLLDIGCGDGKITAQLAGLLEKGQAVGIDASPQMIAFAQKSFPATQYPNLSFQLMDAIAIDLPYTFNLAFSNAALHWIEDHRAVLQSVRSHLQLGGRILFQMGGRGNVSELLRVVNQIIAAPKWERYFKRIRSPYWHFYGPEEYRGWLRETGFEPVRVELLPRDMQHKGPDALKGWLRTTWFPYTNRLPEVLRDEFLEVVLQNYLAGNPPDKAGMTHVAMVRLEVEARAI